MPGPNQFPYFIAPVAPQPLGYNPLQAPIGSVVVAPRPQPIYAPSVGQGVPPRVSQSISAPRSMVPRGTPHPQAAAESSGFSAPGGIGAPVDSRREAIQDFQSGLSGMTLSRNTQGVNVAPKPSSSGKIYQDIKAAVEPLRSYGVSEQQVEHYIRSNAQSHLGTMLTPRDAAAAAAADNQWAAEAQRVGVLTGNRWADELIWKEHWAFNNGLSGRDPLLTGHPESQQRLRAQAENMVRDQNEDYFAPLLSNYGRVSGVE